MMDVSPITIIIDLHVPPHSSKSTFNKIRIIIVRHPAPHFFINVLSIKEHFWSDIHLDSKYRWSQSCHLPSWLHELCWFIVICLYGQKMIMIWKKGAWSIRQQIVVEQKNFRAPELMYRAIYVSCCDVFAVRWEKNCVKTVLDFFLITETTSVSFAHWRTW